VLREPTPDKALAAARRLHDAGFGCVELTTSVPDWSEVVTVLRRELPELVTAVGTITTAEDATTAVAVGAGFLVSPHAAPAAREVARRADVPFIEGGLTPSEVAAAAAHGPAKLFPAHLGGPKYLGDLLSVMPRARIMPTGGIAPEDVQAWLDAGAVAVGIGSALAGRSDLAELAHRLLEPNQTRETP
jgi:2-dehydro-3-deoxyphosphogluconate aldolase/(4S)-4-hydroxy-2-oxoglutarate aldolase